MRFAMYDIILDTLKDGIRLLPFLLITYIIMEYMEHKMSAHTRHVVQASGRFGPLIGSIAGIFPQCGFSAAAASFYAGRVISRGTLIAIFLSTSDEMLPVLISQKAPVNMILFWSIWYFLRGRKRRNRRWISIICVSMTIVTAKKAF